MKCFIHLNNESSGFCTVCKRPICSVCADVENGVCPRCSNFTHKTIFEYNKKILLFLLIVFFVRITFFYDVVVVTLSTKTLLEFTSTGVLVLIAAFLPFCINIMRYGFKNAVRYQVFGKTSAIEIADKLESTFSKEQKKLFEQYWELGTQMCEEEQQQLFLFGYIIATKLNIESKIK